MHRTPYADVNRMLELIQTRIQEILGERLIGLYLSGSLVTGDFDLAVSDIDLVAVTSGDLAPGEIARLEEMHRAIARQEKTWDNRIEVIYITADALRTFRVQPSTIAIISPGEPFHTRAANKDWLVNWYVLRERGIALVGPAPTTLIDPISNRGACSVGAGTRQALARPDHADPAPQRAGVRDAHDVSSALHLQNRRLRLEEAGSDVGGAGDAGVGTADRERPSLVAGGLV